MEKHLCLNAAEYLSAKVRDPAAITMVRTINCQVQDYSLLV